VSVEQWAQAEATLAEQATWLPPRRLAKVAEAVLARLDPDGVAPEDGEDCRDELVWARRRRDGSFVFTGRLHDPVDGEAFCEVIDALAAPCGPEDRRELGRRRADGLKDLVQDARRPGGLTTDTDRSDAGAGVDESEPVDDTAGEDAEDALIPEPRRPGPARPAPERAAAKPAERPGRALVTITMDHRWLQAATG
ncbi:DUF222 domain-containing protein, partial [Actinomycetospora straminea]|uniref:DUF222 domain-containing protein n=1 Tax=Actinomycetospora straminea TaxID=663607 RepID=UPI0031E7DC74